ncbi:MAG TPA: carboxypeptidase regulatory-like domain-containing protein [Pirellulales bacterium]|nr:carboxypeptidase regulatory-like domain-containing protein [Pirellulales bacterium]
MRPAACLGLFLLISLAAACGIYWERRFAGARRDELPRGADLASDGLLAGRVLAGGRAVVGARVRVQGQAHSTLTDEQGRFELPRLHTVSQVSLTASKPGYFIGAATLPAAAETAPAFAEIHLQPLPADDCERYEWVDPTPDAASPRRCGNCHREIYDEWKLSGHAAAASNRRLSNLYDGRDGLGLADRGWGLLAEHPHGAGVCTSCHAPTVEPDDPAFDDLRQVAGIAAQGVHCDLCHKIRDVSIEHVGLAHGRFGIDWLRPAEGQIFFGPLDDAARGDDVHSPLQKQSRYCASCHEGIVFGVPVYTTYSEWLESPARRKGEQCQTCHMTPTGALTNIAPGAGGIDRDPKTLASHQLLPGGREAMLKKCLKLSVAARPAPARIDAGIAAGIDIQVELLARDVGHCVPTGFIDRHLALAVEAFGAGGQIVDAISGPRLPDAAGRALSGRPGRLFARLLSDAEGRSPVPFWRAGATFDDTRLAPEKPAVNRWTFPAAARKVRVRLWYRRFWPETAEAKRWPDDSLLVFERWLGMAEAPLTSSTPAGRASTKSP